MSECSQPAIKLIKLGAVHDSVILLYMPRFLFPYDELSSASLNPLLPEIFFS